MTLNEYIDQTDPQPGVKVVLKEGEYIRRDTVKVNPFSFHTAIDIPAITQRYGIEDSYIWLGNNPRCSHETHTRGNCTEACFSYPMASRNRPYSLSLYNS